MKLSIITINRNNADGLKRTLESVAAQTNKEFEHIIVDGASTDESVNVIKEYAQRVNSEELRVKSVIWVSEPDTGIYNAMNKGIRMSHGEYSLMLNSGDYLADADVVERIIPELHTDGIIQGSMYLGEKLPNKLDKGYGRSEITFFDACRGDFLHQAAFISKSVYETYGYYDEGYRISGDTAFFMNVLGLHNVSFRYVDIPISMFEGGGIGSGNDSKWTAIKHEEDRKMEREILGMRLTKLNREEYKKIQLYDKLHAHRWSWYLTMAVAHLCNLFERKK